jgi:hypothetical protein
MLRRVLRFVGSLAAFAILAGCGGSTHHAERTKIVDLSETFNSAPSARGPSPKPLTATEARRLCNQAGYLCVGRREHTYKVRIN